MNDPFDFKMDYAGEETILKTIWESLYVGKNVAGVSRERGMYWLANIPLVDPPYTYRETWPGLRSFV